MAQSGYTPIQLYRTTTAAATPSAGNLADGELAINTADGKLFYKDSGGNVQTIASKATGTAGGSNNQIQYNSSGALAGSSNLTFDGTTLTANDIVDSSLTASKPVFTNGSKNLVSTGTVPVDQGGTGLSTTTAYGLIAAGTTATGNFQQVSGTGTSGQVLTSNGASALPTWQTSSGVTTGKSIAMAMIFGF
jgi:hypothetical protein